MTPQEKLDFLRAEDIRARFLLYGHTVWALHNHIFWTGFHWLTRSPGRNAMVCCASRME